MFKSSKFWSIAAGVVCTGFIASAPASASVINRLIVDFGNQTQHHGTVPSGETWNHITSVPAKLSSGAHDHTVVTAPITLNFVDGTSSGIAMTFQMGREATTNSDTINSGWDAPWDVNAAHDYFQNENRGFTTSGTQDRGFYTFWFTGLDPSLEYNLDVLSRRQVANNRRQGFWMVFEGDDRQWLEYSARVDESRTVTMPTGAVMHEGAPLDGYWASDAAYAARESMKWTGLKPDANGNLVFHAESMMSNSVGDTVVTPGGTYTYSGGNFLLLSAFELTVVPEPASLGLLGVAGLLMLRRRRAC